MANTPVPVMADMNIKSTGKFKITIQETYRYSHIYFDTPDISNDSFFCRKLKKIVSERFFQIWHLFIFYTGTATTNKLDDAIPVAHF